MRSLPIILLCTAFLSILIPRKASGQGQQGSGSPYSAYGFGDLMGSTQVAQSLMGGTGVALADPYSTVHVNPASYPALYRPVFEAGGVGRFLQYETGSASRSGQRTDLLGLTIGVPFARHKWGLALGVTPMTDVGYLITDRRTLADGGGEVTFQYSGNGGLNRAFIGLGRVVWQNNDTLDRGARLSVGANLNYLFGSIEELRKAYYPVSGNYYNSSASSSLVLRAPTAGIGLQYSADLLDRATVKARLEARRRRMAARNERLEGEWIDAGKDPAEFKGRNISNRQPEALRFRLGATVDLPASLDARHTGLVNSFITSSSGVEFTVDTAWYQEGAQGTVDLPLLFGVGVAVYDSRWTLTAEHRRRDWSGLSLNVDGFERAADLGVQATYALGGSFRPAGEAGGNIWERTTYRMGLRYTDDYLVVAGTQLSEMAASAGLSLPVMSATTRSRVNFGLEVGQRGDTLDGLVRERFVNVFVGITITPEAWDQWFKKRRID